MQYTLIIYTGHSAFAKPTELYSTKYLSMVKKKCLKQHILKIGKIQDVLRM